MDALPLYRQLAAHYQQAIETGTLAPGSRMPSLRALMDRHDVSLSTALQSCRHLERDGFLEARPRSGYFVRLPGKPACRPVAEPVNRLADPAQYVGIHERVSAIIAQGRSHPLQFNLAVACAAAELYPVEALKQAMMRALRHDPTVLTSAATPNGSPALRSVLAQRALTTRIAASRDDIVVTNGCIEALNLALRAVAQPGDVIAVESPTYYGLLQILESLGMKALEIPTSAQNGISVEALELAAQTYRNIKAVVVVPNFQNPLGAVMPDAAKARLVAWCEAHAIPLIEDDTYSLLSNSDTPLAAAKAWDRTGNVIYCASLHKTLAPGMRLGWMIGGRWQARIEMLKYAQTRANEVLPQLAVADFIGSGAYDRHLRRLRLALRDQREQMAEAIATYFPLDTRLTVPQGGLSLWIELPGGASSTALFEQAMNAGVGIAPGRMFSNSDRFEAYFRLSCGQPYTRALNGAMRTLGQLAAAL
ncbi:PLP-dependent aminotransferase family protein [Jeongeupia naejangsanensis]|uniref:Putative 8-amino-7-oxononanoate synthase n=1 Tax=Jeongeupia naejangsanensis TaxID=613195 RepID=A0ABS2BHP4_9NEIS|nr:PLP-dependent aminotransferase family protein [Jeongeupia naejangsanensis]MBM3115126.1 PLP-dependent aminotransferase family protein [Jeongeupia naejangsanensis]